MIPKKRLLIYQIVATLVILLCVNLAVGFNLIFTLIIILGFFVFASYNKLLDVTKVMKVRPQDSPFLNAIKPGLFFGLIPLVAVYLLWRLFEVFYK